MKIILISFIAIFTFLQNTQAQEKSLNISYSNTFCNYSSKGQIHNIVGFYDWLANVGDKNKWFVGEKADLITNGSCNIHTSYDFSFTNKPSDTNLLLIPTLEERLASTSKYQFKKTTSYNTNLGLDFRFNL